MKKMKLNLSGDGIKQFLFNNGEKIVLGLTVLILLLYLFSAITAKPIDDSKSPVAISTESSRKKNELIAETEPPKQPVGEFHVIPDPATPEMYRPKTSYNPPVFPELMPRTDPELFPPAEVQVSADCGIVPYNPVPPAAGAATAANPVIPAPGAFASGHSRAHDDDYEVVPNRRGGPQNINTRAPLAPAAQTTAATVIAGARAKGAQPVAKYWATITALVPYDKQAEEYRRIFEYAKPSGIVEVPHYLSFIVERTEVKDASDMNFNWVQVSVPEATKDMANWMTHSPELADSAYIYPRDTIPYPNGAPGSITTNISWPLPPLFLKNWGVEAVNSKVPLFKPTQAAAEVQPGTLEAPQMDFGNAQNPAANAAPTPESQLAAVNAQNQPAGVVAPPPPANRLFRFVDLSDKKLGAMYRYRVRFVLYNPNYVPLVANAATMLSATQNLAVKDLEKAESGRNFWRASSWSEPTLPVTIPREFRILADSSTPTSGIREPRVKINVISLIKTAADATMAAAGPTGQAAVSDVWLEVTKDMELVLGSIAYIADATIEKVPDMSIEMVRPKIEKVTIDTNGSMLLDVRNDDPLAINGKPRSTAPVEMLFIDANGKLSTTSSPVGAILFKEFKERTTVPADFTTIPVPAPLPGSGTMTPGAKGPTTPGVRNKVYDNGG